MDCSCGKPKCLQCLQCRRKTIDLAAIHAPIIAALQAKPASPSPRTSLPLRPPCGWEGAIATSCTSCSKAKAEENHVRQCSHPSGEIDLCTRNDANSTLRRCSDCKYHATPTEIQHAAILRERISTLPEYAHGHTGRGIVTVAGGARYFKAVWVMLSVLRKHGCMLPVEVWYLHQGEMDERMLELLEQFAPIRIVNAAAVSAGFDESTRPKRLMGWECKAFAIRHSQFREVLFLDADQIPARDPTYLFDDKSYQEHGAVFWPDYEPEGWRVSAQAFRTCGLTIPNKTRNLQWRHPTDYDAWETGQVLVDKSRHWKPLVLWQWFGDHADYWYPGCTTGKGIDLVYGDKDTAYLSWRVLDVPTAVAPKAKWLGTPKGGCFVQHDPAGKAVFYHRVQPQTKYDGDGLESPGVPVWAWCLAALKELRGKWSGRPYDSAGEPGEPIRGVLGGWWLFRNERPDPVSLSPDRSVTGAGLAHWTIRGSLLVLSDPTTGRHFLGRDPCGNWVNHATGTFLMPPPPPDIEIPKTRHDVGLALSVLRDNEYRYPERFPPDSVVLDIGAHVGCSVKAALDRGAAHVVAVEPVPANLVYLRRNFGADPRVTILPVAAWNTSGTLELSDATGNSSGWTATTGRPKLLAVPCAAFGEILAMACAKSPHGRIAMLKLDCEGAEWELVGSSNLDCVDAVAGEWHGDGRDGLFTGQVFAQWLRERGFAAEAVPHRTAERLGNFFARR